MTLEKAIKILAGILNASSVVSTPDGDDAIKLGIEAMKEVAALRKVLVGLGKSLLPGETIF